MLFTLPYLNYFVYKSKIMNPGNDEQLTKKTEQLNALLAENNELVNYIKECEQEIERLAWKIP